MMFFGAALLTLAVVIVMSFKGRSLGQKVGVYLGVGIVTALVLGALGRHEITHHVAMDYIYFIVIPLLVVSVGALNLFGFQVSKSAVGWFLLIVCPLLGNIGTTWSLVPAILGVVHVIKETYPDRWKSISIYCFYICRKHARSWELGSGPS